MMEISIDNICRFGYAQFFIICAYVLYAPQCSLNCVLGTAGQQLTPEKAFLWQFVLVGLFTLGALHAAAAQCRPKAQGKVLLHTCVAYVFILIESFNIHRSSGHVCKYVVGWAIFNLVVNLITTQYVHDFSSYSDNEPRQKKERANFRCLQVFAAIIGVSGLLAQFRPFQTKAFIFGQFFDINGDAFTEHSLSLWSYGGAVFLGIAMVLVGALTCHTDDRKLVLQYVFSFIFLGTLTVFQHANAFIDTDKAILFIAMQNILLFGGLYAIYPAPASKWLCRVFYMRAFWAGVCMCFFPAIADSRFGPLAGELAKSVFYNSVMQQLGCLAFFICAFWIVLSQQSEEAQRTALQYFLVPLSIAIYFEYANPANLKLTQFCEWCVLSERKIIFGVVFLHLYGCSIWSKIYHCCDSNVEEVPSSPKKALKRGGRSASVPKKRKSA